MLKCGLVLSTSLHCTELVQAKKTLYFPRDICINPKYIDISDTFYDPDGTQPTGYVGQVSLNSIQQNRRSCLGLSNLARSHIHHLHIIMHDTSQPHSFSALSTIFFRILPASRIAGPLQWLTRGSKQKLRQVHMNKNLLVII